MKKVKKNRRKTEREMYRKHSRKRGKRRKKTKIEEKKAPVVQISLAEFRINENEKENVKMSTRNIEHKAKK